MQSRRLPRARRPVVVALSALLAVVLAGLAGTPGTWPHRTAPILDRVAGAPDAPEPGIERHLVIDGLDRTYRVFAPTPAPATRVPLLVFLHGRGQSAQAAIAESGFLDLVRRRTAVVAYPDGVDRSWNAGGGCCGAAGHRQLPDTAFVTAVVAAAVHDLPVDPSRVYLAGYSNGGKLTYGTTCGDPRPFAAVATYGAVPLSPCPGAPPAPFLLAAGRLDRVLPFAGDDRARPALPSVDTAVGWLRARDGCDGRPVTAAVGPARTQRWTRCRAGSEVVAVLYPDRGHALPGGGSPDAPAAVSTLMWSFLSAHRLPDTVGASRH